MKTILLFVLLFIEKIKSEIVINKQTNCPVFYCTDIEAPTNGICFTFAKERNNGLIQLKHCPRNQECLYNLFFPIVYNTVSCTPIQINYYSGNDYGYLVEQDFCSTDSQCASNICANNTCVGLNIGSSCYNSTQCSASSYCNPSSKICEKRRLAGESCKNDDDCVNDSECFNNKCTKLYSLMAGTNVTSDAYSRFCYSNFTLNGVCEDLINVGSAPYFCDAIVGCNYTTSISKSNYFDLMHCNCDFKGNGFAFCQMGTDTVIWANYINVVQQSLSNYPCHFYNKLRCNAMPYNVTVSVFNAQLDVLQMDTRLKCFYPSQPLDNPAINCPGSKSCQSEFIKIWMNFLFLFMLIWF